MNNRTHVKDLEKSEVKDKTKKLLKKIGELQHQMYAERRHSLLLVFQGMDASGKDGLVKGLLRYGSPVGIRIKSYKKPTPEEYSHDFLWRVHQHAPPQGFLQVFIRSHYEDILVPTVEQLFPPEVIEPRYALINDFEKLLESNGTTILKFFLYVSPEVQEERLRDRLEDPRKHWKHNDADWETKKKFDRYLQVYDRILERCNAVPWHVIPADTNWQKLYFVALAVVEALEGMKLEWPPLVTAMQ